MVNGGSICQYMCFWFMYWKNRSLEHCTPEKIQIGWSSDSDQPLSLIIWKLPCFLDNQLWKNLGNYLLIIIGMKLLSNK
jgi:hypothetical protein